MITREAETMTVALIGKYIVGHAGELIVMHCSDLMEDEFFIHMKRRKDAPETEKVKIGD